MGRFLVIGGCRFIGYDVAASLIEEGNQVIIYDDTRCPSTPSGIARIIISPPTDYERLLEEARDADVIYNFYEYSGVIESRRNPEKAFARNVMVSSLLYRIVAHSRVYRVIHASTAGVYGEAQYLPITEEHPTNPLNWYGATKLAGEILAREIHVEKKVDTVILRFFNVYGPGEWMRENPGVIHYFIINALMGAPLRLEGGGGQVRDFIHVADAVRASLTALDIKPGIYNVGSGRGVSIRDVLAIIQEIHGSPLEVVIAPARFNDISRSVADIGRISEASKWRPLIPLRDGLRHLYNLYRERLQVS